MDGREKAAVRMLCRKDNVAKMQHQAVRDALAAHGVARALYVIRVAKRVQRRYCDAGG